MEDTVLDANASHYLSETDPGRNNTNTASPSAIPGQSLLDEYYSRLGEARSIRRDMRTLRAMQSHLRLSESGYGSESSVVARLRESANCLTEKDQEVESLKRHCIELGIYQSPSQSSGSELVESFSEFGLDNIPDDHLSPSSRPAVEKTVTFYGDHAHHDGMTQSQPKNIEPMRWDEEAIPNHVREADGSVYISHVYGDVKIETNQTVHIEHVNGDVFIRSNDPARIDQRNSPSRTSERFLQNNYKHAPLSPRRYDGGDSKSGTDGIGVHEITAKRNEASMLLHDQAGDGVQIAEERVGLAKLQEGIANNMDDLNTRTPFSGTKAAYLQRWLSVPDACWYVPFPRNQRFVGRDVELHQLNNMLFANNRPAKIAITGLGGVGKTQIALELAYRMRENYPECSVFWVPVTRGVTGLQRAFLDIGQQLEVPGIEEEQVDVRKLVQGHLSQERAGQWLLIADNVDDMDMWNYGLKDYLPNSRQGCVVFTTRSRKIAVKIAAANVIAIPEMDGNVGMQLLGKSLLNQTLLNSQHNTLKLLEQLTFLPLAIVQAAAYINENGIELSDYMSLLEEQEQDVVDLLSEDFEDEGRYQDVKSPVATTWLISFEQVQRLDPLADDYLSFMSCIAPKDIPQSLLPPGPSRKKEIDAIGTLNAYSFVSRRTADNALDVHRLVHLVRRNWLRERGVLAEWDTKAMQRLGEVFPDDDYRNRSIWRLYLAQARYVLGSGSAEDNGGERARLAQKLASCLYSDGRYNEAEQRFLQVMKTFKKVLGPEHPDTLTSMAKLASTYRNQGRWKEAEELELQAMETRKQVLGTEHPDMLTSMANLASTYSNQGRWKEAEELEVQVIETRKLVLGSEHPDTLSSMANLALTYSNQGRWKEAEELQVQVMGTSLRVLGPEHPSTLTSFNNLAITLKGQSHDSKAVLLMEECIRLRKRILGPQHPYTTSSLSTLTKWRPGIVGIGS